MAKYRILLLFPLLLASCMPSPYYQKTHTVANNAWNRDYKPSYRVLIRDTTVYYSLFLIIRHTEAYPYSNIWLRVYSKGPGDSTADMSRIEIPLAAPSGQWLGRGMGTIWEHRMILSAREDRHLFGKPGTYELSLEQDMRVDPLPEILQVGLRVEKGSGKPPAGNADNP